VLTACILDRAAVLMLLASLSDVQFARGRARYSQHVCQPSNPSAAAAAFYLQNVKPGKARVITCLMEAMAQPNFGAECRAELQQRQSAVKNDYRWGVGG
jgi:hypothetical protein